MGAAALHWTQWASQAQKTNDEASGESGPCYNCWMKELEQRLLAICTTSSLAVGAFQWESGLRWVLLSLALITLGIVLATSIVPRLKEGRNMKLIALAILGALREMRGVFAFVVVGMAISDLAVALWPSIQDNITWAWSGAAVASGYLATVRWYMLNRQDDQTGD